MLAAAAPHQRALVEAADQPSAGLVGERLFQRVKEEARQLLRGAAREPRQRGGGWAGGSEAHLNVVLLPSLRVFPVEGALGQGVGIDGGLRGGM